MSADNVGISNEFETPRMAAKMRICQIAILPVITNKPSPQASAICTYCVISKIFRLSNRSAAAPPIIVSRSIGKPAARLAMPNQSALVVSVLIT